MRPSSSRGEPGELHRQLLHAHLTALAQGDNAERGSRDAGRPRHRAREEEPHYHCVLPDGVFVRDADGAVRFAAVRPPDDDELQALLEKLVPRLERVLRPLLEQPDAGDAQASDYAAAVQAVLPVGDDEAPTKKRLTAFLLGYSRQSPGRLALRA